MSKQSIACSDTLTYQHGLVIIQLGLLITLSVFLTQIYRIFKQLPDYYKDDLKKFRTYHLVVFSMLCASWGFLVLYIVFQSFLPQNKWTTYLIYGLLFILGVIGTSLSADGFVKLQSKDKSLESENIINKFKNFFIISMSLSVIQTFFCFFFLFKLNNT